LENIELEYDGITHSDTVFIRLDSLQKVPEREKNYPEFDMFGELPSWALYVRHTEGVILKNIIFKLKKNDFRPALVFDDVINLFTKKVVFSSKCSRPIVFCKDVKKGKLQFTFPKRAEALGMFTETQISGECLELIYNFKYKRM
jgi:hypothetical protein